MSKKPNILSTGIASALVAIPLVGLSTTALGLDTFARRVPGEVEETVVSHRVSGPIPTDPLAATWNMVTAVEIPVPREYDHPDEDDPILPPQDPELRPEFKQLYVKSLNNGSEIFFHFEWRDETEDTTVADPPLFADGVALQVPFSGEVLPTPIDPVTGEPVIDPVTGLPEVADIHMGDPDNPVNILFWRADFSKVQNATGAGEGTVQITNVQINPDTGEVGESDLNIVHEDRWRGRRWLVVMGRPMQAEDAETQANFTAGTTLPIAWSMWDGNFRERNGNKYANGDWDKLVIEE